MGDDGAIGMRDMKERGIMTIAQSEESCVVFGMPREAIRLGGVERIVHLHDIAAEMNGFSRRFS
jgi:two-component system chemotaxis response regulator CheB